METVGSSVKLLFFRYETEYVQDTCESAGNCGSRKHPNKFKMPF